MIISDDKVKAIQERLKKQAKSSPQSKANSKMDVIRASFEHIERLREKGFRMEDIAAEIAETGGFQLSAATLKNYVQRIRVERGKGARPAKPKAQKSRTTARRETNTPAATQPSSDRQSDQTPGTFRIKEDRNNL